MPLLLALALLGPPQDATAELPVFDAGPPLVDSLGEAEWLPNWARALPTDHEAPPARPDLKGARRECLLEGSLVDTEGRPIPGALLSAFIEPDPRTPIDPRALATFIAHDPTFLRCGFQAVTDVEGHFRIANLWPGPQRVVIHHGDAFARRRATTLATAPASTQPEPVTLVLDRATLPPESRTLCPGEDLPFAPRFGHALFTIETASGLPFDGFLEPRSIHVERLTDARDGPPPPRRPRVADLVTGPSYRQQLEAGRYRCSLERVPLDGPAGLQQQDLAPPLASPSATFEIRGREVTHVRLRFAPVGRLEILLGEPLATPRLPAPVDPEPGDLRTLDDPATRIEVTATPLDAAGEPLSLTVFLPARPSLRSAAVLLPAGRYRLDFRDPTTTIPPCVAVVRAGRSTRVMRPLGCPAR